MAKGSAARVARVPGAVARSQPAVRNTFGEEGNRATDKSERLGPAKLAVRTAIDVGALAAKVGVSRQWIVEVEKGGNDLALENLA
jgi:hypothetical protein